MLPRANGTATCTHEVVLFFPNGLAHKSWMQGFPSKPCTPAPLLEDNGGAMHQATPTCLLGNMTDAAHEVLVQVSGPCSAVDPLRLQCQVPNIVVFEHCVPALQALVLCPLGEPLAVGNQVHCIFKIMAHRTSQCESQQCRLGARQVSMSGKMCLWRGLVWSQ